jgi:hypothetical protein
MFSLSASFHKTFRPNWPSSGVRGGFKESAVLSFLCIRRIQTFHSGPWLRKHTLYTWWWPVRPKRLVKWNGKKKQRNVEGFDWVAQGRIRIRTLINFIHSAAPAVTHITWLCVTYDYKTNFGLDDWIYFTLYTHTTRDYRQYCAIADLKILQFTVPHAPGSSVFTSRILVTDL